MADKIEKLDNWQEEFKNFNNELEEKILEANHDESKVKWSKLLPELLDKEIFIAGQLSDTETDENGNPKIGIVAIQQNNRPVIPFFSSPERISVLASAGNNQFDVIKIKVVNFFATIKGQSAILNPMSTYSRKFTPFEMKILTAEYWEKHDSDKEEKA